MLQICLDDAKKLNKKAEVGLKINVKIESKEFGRIATQNAKNVILQKIREEERNALYEEWHCREKDIVTGIVQRYVGRNISINLGKADAMLTEKSSSPIITKIDCRYNETSASNDVFQPPAASPSGFQTGRGFFVRAS